MRVLLLRKDRTVKIKNANSRKRDFEENKSLYILSADRIQNYVNSHGAIRGSEIIFFEDNPNGISGNPESKDLSTKYLDDVVTINFIQQATDTMGKWELPSFGLGWIFERPERIPLILMVGWVAWIVIQNWITSGGALV